MLRTKSIFACCFPVDLLTGNKVSSRQRISRHRARHYVSQAGARRRPASRNSALQARRWIEPEPARVRQYEVEHVVKRAGESEGDIQSTLWPSQILAHAGLRPQFAVKVMTLVQ